jgi:hypothetical protein
MSQKLAYGGGGPVWRDVFSGDSLTVAGRRAGTNGVHPLFSSGRDNTLNVIAPRSIISNGTTAILVGRRVDTGVVGTYHTTVDGKEWTSRTLPFAGQYSSGIWTGTTFLVAETNGNTYRSTDGITGWAAGAGLGIANGVIYKVSGTLVAFAAAGGTGYRTSIDDGASWITRTLPFNPANETPRCCVGVLSNKLVYVAPGSYNIGSLAWATTDGITWTSSSLPILPEITSGIQSNCLVATNSKFIFISPTGTAGGVAVCISTDAVTWSYPASYTFANVGDSLVPALGAIGSFQAQIGSQYGRISSFGQSTCKLGSRVFIPICTNRRALDGTTYIHSASILHTTDGVHWGYEDMLATGYNSTYYTAVGLNPAGGLLFGVGGISAGGCIYTCTNPDFKELTYVV